VGGAHAQRELSRRRFVQGAGVAGLGLLAGCGGLPWQAPPKVHRLGYLSNSSPTDEATRLDAFQQGLREYGYVEGQNIVSWRGTRIVYPS
jgi:hypothetical protein